MASAIPVAPTDARRGALAQRQSYEDQGYLLVPDVFSAGEIDAIRSELAVLFAWDSPARVFENDGKTVRSVYAPHHVSPLFERLARDSRLLDLVTTILDSPVYIHQYKVNVKAGFGGDVWRWHQDYVFWHLEDGMPSARALNVVLFVDEVNPFNGPLLIVPRSDREGIVGLDDDRAAASSEWESHLAADLKYALDRDTMQRLVERYGVVGPTGGPGTVLLFHPSVVHGSAANMYPFDRVVVIITYNSVLNVPVPRGPHRPDFLVGRVTEPLAALDRGASFAHA